MSIQLEKTLIMRKKRLNLLDLRTCLSYDSEVKKFLSLKERCIMHHNQIKILEWAYPLEIPVDLIAKIEEKLIEIRRKRWKRPEYHFEKERNTIIRTKIR